VSFDASQALDVAIGLVLLFALLSVVCSGVNEAIATVLSWRSEFLERGLRSMLAEDVPGERPPGVPTVDAISEHPLIRGAVEKPTTGAPPPEHPTRWDRFQDKLPVKLRARLPKRRAFPSYLDPHTFSLVMLDTLTGGKAVPPGDEQASRDMLKKVRDRATGLPGPVGKALQTLADDAGGDLNRFRGNIERWFDNTMTQVSGWYKRKVNVSLWVIAALVTLAFNADALQVGRSLWQDDAVRASVVASAQKQVDEGDASAENVAGGVADVRELGVPLGWSFEQADPRWPDDFLGFVGKFFGLLVTIVALSMGSAFWFDLLGRVSRVRGAARPERDTKGDAR
jgi:hypothetical protein